MKKFRVQAKSVFADPWGNPILETDDLHKAIGDCCFWFNEEGFYSRILDDEDNVIFVDYRWVDDWELMY